MDRGSEKNGKPERQGPESIKLPLPRAVSVGRLSASIALKTVGCSAIMSACAHIIRSQKRLVMTGLDHKRATREGRKAHLLSLLKMIEIVMGVIGQRL